MGTIQSTTHATPLPYPSNSMVTLNSTGSGYIALVRMPDAPSATFKLRFSSDQGANWVDTTASTIVRSGLQAWSGIRIDGEGHIHWAYRVYESGEDRIYYRRIRRAEGQYTVESEKLVAAATAGSAGAKYQGLDIVSHNVGDDKWNVPIAVGTTSGSVVGVTMFGVFVDRDKNRNWRFTVKNGMFTGTRIWTTTGTGEITPSIDLTDDEGLFVTWSKPGLYVTRMGYNRSTKTWNGGTFAKSVTKLKTSGVTRNYTPGRFDGKRFIVAHPANDTVEIYERTATNSQYATRTSPAHPTGNIREVTFSFVYSGLTGDIRVYAIGTSSGLLYYVDYVRATNTWGSWTSTGVTPDGITQFGVKNRNRRTDQGNHFLYYEFPNATVVSLAQALTFAPDTPTIIGPSRAVAFDLMYVVGNGGVWDADTGITFAWTFSDSDPLDVQTKYAISRQVGAGSVLYFRASDNTWQATEQQNSDSNTSKLLLSTVWDDAASPGVPHTFKVKVWDSTNLPSSYSDGFVIIPETDSVPAFTYPLPQNGGTIVTVPNPTFTWTVSGAAQAAYRIFVEKDVPSSSADVLVLDTGWIESTDTSHTPAAILEDGFGYYAEICLRTASGLPTMIAANNWSYFNADIPNPPVPTLVVTATPSTGSIEVVTTNPAPTGGEPAFDFSELYRREVGDTTDGTRIVTGLLEDATYQDYTAASGVDYEYRSKTYGVNNAFTYSAWTD